ncbi:MAG: TAXI family TRAP transporter solute-binding subunit [Vicinamibacterales bacterium]
MRGWRAIGAAAAVCAASVVVLAALLEFLAPDLSYQIKDRTRELVSGDRGRKLRIALGSPSGSAFRIGSVLNRYLKERAGYELELVVSVAPGNVRALLDPKERIDLASINSADDEAAKPGGVYGLAALEPQYFFVIVPNESPVQEFRDLSGPVNPGVRDAGDPPTLGERVLDYYGLTSSRSRDAAARRVSIVRPNQGNLADFEAGHMTASTRTQSLHTDLVGNILQTGQYRLVPIRDHEALAHALPGTRPAVIPPGLFGPERRIPPAPVPTITVTQLLVARGDLPGRVVRDILGVIYDPRFARDIQYEVTEEAGRRIGSVPLHPAAEIYYHRNDLPTSDRLGRISFVASGIAALIAAIQFISRVRRNERVRSRHRLLATELAKLQGIRQRLDETPDPEVARTLIREADDLLCEAERDAAAGLLDTEGIQALRSLHQVCWRALEQRSGRSVASSLATIPPATASPQSTPGTDAAVVSAAGS